MQQTLPMLEYILIFTAVAGVFGFGPELWRARRLTRRATFMIAGAAVFAVAMLTCPYLLLLDNPSVELPGTWPQWRITLSGILQVPAALLVLAGVAMKPAEKQDRH